MSKITVYTARKVRTMDPGRPLAEAVAVMDGKVVSTGTLASMKPWLDRHEHVIDNTLADKVILPGFIDPHTHFYQSSCYLALHYVGPLDTTRPIVPQSGLLTHEDVVAKLRAIHESEPDRTRPMVAWGLDPASQGGATDRDELDAIFGDRPIWVITYAPHFVYVNSAALKQIGNAARVEDHAARGIERRWRRRLAKDGRHRIACGRDHHCGNGVRQP